MNLSPVKIVWGDYENETLIHNHKMAKLYKKRYQRASDLYNSLFSFFGLIAVVSSSIATTLLFLTTVPWLKVYLSNLLV